VVWRKKRKREGNEKRTGWKNFPGERGKLLGHRKRLPKAVKDSSWMPEKNLCEELDGRDLGETQRGKSTGERRKKRLLQLLKGGAILVPIICL